MKQLALSLMLAIGTLLMGSCFWPYDDYYYEPRGYVVHHHYERAPRHHVSAPPRHHRPVRR